MDLGIEGRRALVAASTSGLGLSTARALAEAGCRVVVSGRDEERLAVGVDSIAGSVGVTADVSTPAGAVKLVEDAIGALGGIDILVANAGGAAAGGFDDVDVDDYGAALDLNLMSVVALCKAAVPAMRAQGWGRVVAITSLSVRQPIDGLILSNTARAGATGFLKTMASAVAADGVTVNSVQPGFHATARLLDVYGGDLDQLAGQVPVRALGDPDDFGRVCAFLCSETAKFITGTAVPVDGGAHRALQ